MGSVTYLLIVRILNYVRRRQASFVRCNNQIRNDMQKRIENAKIIFVLILTYDVCEDTLMVITIL